MNEIISAARRHFMKSAEQKKAATARCAQAFKGCKKLRPPVTLDIDWFEPSLKRDFDNVTAGVKFILDGMVGAGKIPDDSRRFVTSITHRVSLDRENPRVEVTVKELNG